MRKTKQLDKKMKKKFLKLFVAFAAVAVVALGSYKAKKTCQTEIALDKNLLMAENIEALATDESTKNKFRNRCETTRDITIAKLDIDGKYIGDSIIGYTHAVVCEGIGQTPCTPGCDTHMFNDTDYECTIEK